MDKLNLRRKPIKFSSCGSDRIVKIIYRLIDYFPENLKCYEDELVNPIHHILSEMQCCQ